MDRQQYLRELEARLSNRMKPDALARVIHYYEEYFDEAGPEGEAQAILDLGSPAELTERIMGGDSGKQTEQRGRTDRWEEEDWPIDRPRKGLGMVWKVLLTICAAPVAIPVIIGLVAGGIVLLVGVLGVFAALGLAGVVGIAAGVFTAAAGFGALLTHGMTTTMLFVGGGMMAAGLGGLLLAGAFALTGLCLRGVARLLSRALRRREARA